MDSDRDLYSGMVRQHILHHASEGPVFGLGIIDELRRHAYAVSAGTLYPMLHGLQRKGYLSSHVERDGRSARRIYEITATGRLALALARKRVRELFGELIEGSGRSAAQAARRRGASR
jgi:DNA-binding PadR family transcriptional regulator